MVHFAHVTQFANVTIVKQHRLCVLLSVLRYSLDCHDYWFSLHLSQSPYFRCHFGYFYIVSFTERGLII